LSSFLNGVCEKYRWLMCILPLQTTQRIILRKHVVCRRWYRAIRGLFKTRFAEILSHFTTLYNISTRGRQHDKDSIEITIDRTAARRMRKKWKTATFVVRLMTDKKFHNYTHSLWVYRIELCGRWTPQPSLPPPPAYEGPSVLKNLIMELTGEILQYKVQSPRNLTATSTDEQATANRLWGH